MPPSSRPQRREPAAAQPQQQTDDAGLLSQVLTETEKWGVTYVPFGEKESISFRVRDIRLLMSVKSKKGVEPDDRDCIRFAKLCQAKGLNPWVGDAFLVGYDSQSGPTTFQQITAYQALLKRAEANENFGGMESGLLVFDKEQSDTLISRQNALALPGDTIYGAWATVYRDDHERAPHKARVKFETYNTDRSRWSKDPEGMICKVAKAAALREAFPTQLGGLYTGEEMDHVTGGAEPTAADADAALEQAAEGADAVSPGPDNPAGHDPTPQPEAPPEAAQGEPEPDYNPPSEEELESERALLMVDYRGLITDISEKHVAGDLSKKIAGDTTLTRPQKETLQSELADHVAKN